MNTELSISFIKANHQTIGHLKKRSEELHAFYSAKKRVDEINQFTGNFKSVEKEGNKLNTQNGNSKGLYLPSSLPQTDILTQININNVQNTATAKADVFRDMGIEIF